MWLCAVRRRYVHGLSHQRFFPYVYGIKLETEWSEVTRTQNLEYKNPKNRWFVTTIHINSDISTQATREVENHGTFQAYVYSVNTLMLQIIGR